MSIQHKVPVVAFHTMTFALPDVGQLPCLYGHPLEIQPDYGPAGGT